MAKNEDERFIMILSHSHEMQKETHILIANLVSYQLGYDHKGKNAYLLRYSSVLPDIWKDFPHHRGKDEHIKIYLGEARAFFLKGDMDTAIMRLGVAFHYIADRWTLMTGSDERHSSWEREINKCARYTMSNLSEQISKEFKQDLFSRNIHGYSFTGNPSIDDLLKGVNTNINFNFDFNVPQESSEEDKGRIEIYRTFCLKLSQKLPSGQHETLNYSLMKRPIDYSWPMTDFIIAVLLCKNIAISIFSSKEPPDDLLKTKQLIKSKWSTSHELDQLKPPAVLDIMYTRVLHQMRINEQKFDAQMSKLEDSIVELKKLMKAHGDECNRELIDIQKMADNEKSNTGFFRRFFVSGKYTLRKRKVIRSHRKEIERIKNEKLPIDHQIQETKGTFYRINKNLKNKLCCEAQKIYDAEKDWYNWPTF